MDPARTSTASRSASPATFDIDYPADHANAELAGQRVAFRVDDHGARARELPALDDEFAKEHGDCDDARRAARSGCASSSRRRRSAMPTSSVRAALIARLVTLARLRGAAGDGRAAHRGAGRGGARRPRAAPPAGQPRGARCARSCAPSCSERAREQVKAGAGARGDRRARSIWRSATRRSTRASTALAEARGQGARARARALPGPGGAREPARAACCRSGRSMSVVERADDHGRGTRIGRCWGAREMARISAGVAPAA